MHIKDNSMGTGNYFDNNQPPKERNQALSRIQIQVQPRLPGLADSQCATNKLPKGLGPQVNDNNRGRSILQCTKALCQSSPCLLQPQTVHGSETIPQNKLSNYLYNPSKRTVGRRMVQKLAPTARCTTLSG